MKKFIYLMAMVCTLGFFTACSSDDDNDEILNQRKQKYRAPDDRTGEHET